MNKLQDVSVIIPALNPDEKLLELLEKLNEQGFEPPLLVNDGSSQECEAYFKTAEEKYHCTILKHEENRGKGRALKTAFSYLLEKKTCSYAVTIDADGQHAPEDVLRCVLAAKEPENRGKIIFGCRNFNEPHVPRKSRWGNKSMCILMRFTCGMNLSDTQTGLRVFPKEYFSRLLEIEGERFEYETNMLIDIQREKISYGEVKIKTVYIENNRSSHFRPFADSMIIIRPFFHFLISSCGSSLVDLGAFALLFWLMKNLPEREAIWFATVAARILSACCNYMLNRHRVFGQGSRKSPVKYMMLCVLQMCMSAALVAAIYGMVGSGATLIKIVVDVCLFFLSYQIQREWVFAE